MTSQRALPIRLLNLRLARLLIHAQNLIVILALALLQLQLRVAYLPRDTRFARVGFLDVLEFAHGFLPVACRAHGFGLGLARFGVGGIEFESLCAVGDGGGILLDFEIAERAVLQDLAVRDALRGVDLQRARIRLDRVLVLARLELGVALLFCAF